MIDPADESEVEAHAPDPGTLRGSDEGTPEVSNLGAYDRRSVRHRRSVPMPQPTMSDRVRGHLERIDSIAEALVEAVTYDAVAQVVVNEMVAALGGALGGCAIVVGADGGHLEFVGMSGVPDEWRREYGLVSLDSPLPITDAVRSRRPVYLESSAAWAARYPHLAGTAAANDMEGAAAIPCIANGRVVGALSLGFAEPRTFDAGDRSLLVDIAQQCADALDRARLLAAERSARVAAEERSRQLHDILESVTDAFVAYDDDWRFLFVNRRAAEIFEAYGASEDLVGRVLWDAFPSLLGTRVEMEMRRAARSHEPAEFETFDERLGKWLQIRLCPSSGGLSAYWTDITERHQAEERLRFLVLASERLVDALDLETALASVVWLAVPALADACAIHLLDRHGRPRLVEVAHRDPAKTAMARRLEDRSPDAADSAAGVTHVVHAGQASFEPEIPVRAPEEAAPEEERFRLEKALGYRSRIIAPIVARGETVGAITIACAESGRTFGLDDLTLMEELGRRAGTAVDNARLHASALSANRTKAEFLAVMSHELRTPLTAIVGHTQLLTEGVAGPLSERQRAHLTRVQASSHHLLGLIDELLGLARLDESAERVTVVPFALGGLLDHLDSLARDLMARKGLGWRCERPAEPLELTSDEPKLRQVLVNLIVNAAKFTAIGDVALSARVDGDEVVLAVTDTGIGIPSDHLERIFEPFWQVDQKMTRTAGGTGLGLAVARRLTRLLGGDIAVRSEVGTGSTFTVTIPREH